MVLELLALGEVVTVAKYMKGGCSLVSGSLASQILPVREKIIKTYGSLCGLLGWRQRRERWYVSSTQICGDGSSVLLVPIGTSSEDSTWVEVLLSSIVFSCGT